MKKCPYCAEPIAAEAILCRHCGLVPVSPEWHAFADRYLADSTAERAKALRELTSDQQQELEGVLAALERNGVKRCPYCAEQIRKAAIKCRYCCELLEVEGSVRPPRSVRPPSRVAMPALAPAAVPGARATAPANLPPTTLQFDPVPDPGGAHPWPARKLAAWAAMGAAGTLVLALLLWAWNGSNTQAGTTSAPRLAASAAAVRAPAPAPTDPEPSTAPGPAEDPSARAVDPPAPAGPQSAPADVRSAGDRSAAEPSPPGAEALPAGPGGRLVARRAAYLRTGPGRDFAVAGEVTAGEQLLHEGRAGDWYQLASASAEKVWIHRSVVAPEPDSP